MGSLRGTTQSALNSAYLPYLTQFACKNLILELHRIIHRVRSIIYQTEQLEKSRNPAWDCRLFRHAAQLSRHKLQFLAWLVYNFRQIIITGNKAGAKCLQRHLQAVPRGRERGERDEEEWALANGLSCALEDCQLAQGAETKEQQGECPPTAWHALPILTVCS